MGSLLVIWPVNERRVFESEEQTRGVANSAEAKLMIRWVWPIKVGVVAQKIRARLRDT